MLAEVIQHYFPKLVQLHNYSAANSTKQKMYNWSTLSRELPRLQASLPCTHVPGRPRTPAVSSGPLVRPCALCPCLAEKVLRRMKFELSAAEIEAVVNCTPDVVEHVLMRLQACISDIKARRSTRSSGGGSASHGLGASGGSSAFGGAMPGSSRAAPEEDHGYPSESPAAAAAFPSTAAPHSSASSGAGPAETAALVHKEQRIQELLETNEYLELKIRKLEQLVRLKDNRIATLQAKLASQRDGMA